MRLLLDTHAFLWWRLDDPQLGRSAREAILDPGNEVFVSAVVGWEIAIKRGLGRLDFEGTVAAAVADEGFTPLAVDLRHTDELANLPSVHRDPFDRLLVAQARTEGLTLVTRDPQVQAYPGFRVVWDR